MYCTVHVFSSPGIIHSVYGSDGLICFPGMIQPPRSPRLLCQFFTCITMLSHGMFLFLCTHMGQTFRGGTHSCRLTVHHSPLDLYTDSTSLGVRIFSYSLEWYNSCTFGFGPSTPPQPCGTGNYMRRLCWLKLCLAPPFFRPSLQRWCL